MSDKVKQEKIESVKHIKEAFEKAKQEGLVTSRPITLDEQKKHQDNKTDS